MAEYLYGDEFTNRPELRRKRAVAVMVQRITIGLIITYCVATITLLLLLGYQGEAQRDRLADCTTPSGKCYQEGQKRTAEAIQALINDNQLTRDTVVIAVACAQNRENDTNEDIMRCIEQHK